MKPTILTHYHCAMVKPNGKVCSIFVKHDGDFCPQHDPNAPAKPPAPDPILPKIETIEDVIHAQSVMLSKMMIKAEPNSKDFASFAQLSRAFVTNKSEMELSKRLDAMEKTLKQSQ